MIFLDLLQRGNADTYDDGDGQPRQDDNHRKSVDRPGYERLRVVFVTPVLVAHADLSRQKVKAFTSCVILSALTTPSTTIRQPILSLSPCATMFPTTAAKLVAISSDQGRLAPSTSFGSALTS